MDEITFDNYTYVEAPPPRVTFVEIVLLVLVMLWEAVKVMVLSVPIILAWIYRIVIPKPRKSLKGKIILITGGGNGLGRAIALQVAQEQCYIAVVDWDLTAAEKTAQDINNKKVAKAIAYKVDVSKVDQIEVLSKRIEADFGFIDLLINNAGIISPFSLREGTPDNIQMVVDVNLMSHIWMARQFLPGMISRRRGHIVAVSSVSALGGLPNAVTYTATKHAVRGFMLALGEELRQDKHDFIKLSCILPFFIATRKELMDMLQMRVPSLSPQYAAKVAVEGIRSEIQEFTIPRPILFMSTLLKNLPYRVQQIIADVFDIKLTLPESFMIGNNIRYNIVNGGKVPL